MYAIKYIRDIINAERPTVLERGQSAQCFGAHVNYSLSFMFLAEHDTHMPVCIFRLTPALKCLL